MKLALTEKEWSDKIDGHKKKLGSSTAETPQLLKNYEGELEKCYKKVVLTDIEKEENIWDTYPAANFDATQQASFEYFVCGYLQYYDEVVRNYGIDHALRFKWEKDLVVVYICPRPRRRNEYPETCPPASLSSDPVPPTAPPPPYP